MASCSFCGNTVVFGGVRQGGLHFCSEKCAQQGLLLQVAAQVPDDVIAEYVVAVHEGTCPRCGGPGPIDVHTSHTVWSLLIVTSWRSKPQVCCGGCGVKAKLWGIFLSSLFGWWGFPWGLFATPVQIARNLKGLVMPPDPMRPSKQLAEAARLDMAAQLAEQELKQDDSLDS